MPLETNAYKLKSKNNNYADQSGPWYLRKAVKWKAFLEKAKPYVAKSNETKQNKTNKTERGFGTFQ